MGKLAWKVLIDIAKTGSDMVGWLLDGDPEYFRARFEDYHGFMKYRFSYELLAGVLMKHHLRPEEVQVELVKVVGDQTGEIHHHAESRAFCQVLGELDGLENPRGAHAFFRDSWNPIFDDFFEVQIEAGVKHGFTVEEGGVLYFLSVQSPPIKGEDHDDYHKEESVPLPKS